MLCLNGTTTANGSGLTLPLGKSSINEIVLVRPEFTTSNVFLQLPQKNTIRVRTTQTNLKHRKKSTQKRCTPCHLRPKRCLAAWSSWSRPHSATAWVLRGVGMGGFCHSGTCLSSSSQWICTSKHPPVENRWERDRWERSRRAWGAP